MQYFKKTKSKQTLNDVIRKEVIKLTECHIEDANVNPRRIKGKLINIPIVNA